MLHFPILEQHGVTACISEKSDGDATREGCVAMFPDYESLTMVQQVHGRDAVVSVAGSDDCEADAILVTPGAPPGIIRVADCVPVWLFDPVVRAGAVIHAGREGTRLGIVGATLERLIRDNDVEPSRVLGVIGPSAGPCCYEVSVEMADDFERSGGVREERMLDLWSTNRNQLFDHGVLPGNVDVTTLCTICCGRFHSYRRDKTTARNAAFLQIPKV